jgi:hypothetical protein
MMMVVLVVQVVVELLVIGGGSGGGTILPPNNLGYRYAPINFRTPAVFKNGYWYTVRYEKSWPNSEDSADRTQFLELCSQYHNEEDCIAAYDNIGNTAKLEKWKTPWDTDTREILWVWHNVQTSWSFFSPVIAWSSSLNNYKGVTPFQDEILIFLFQGSHYLYGSIWSYDPYQIMAEKPIPLVENPSFNNYMEEGYMSFSQTEYFVPSVHRVTMCNLSNGYKTYDYELDANPIWCLIDFLIEPRYGCGVDVKRIDLPSIFTLKNWRSYKSNFKYRYNIVFSNPIYSTSFIEAWNYCDELVYVAEEDKREPRFRYSNYFNSKLKGYDFLQDILQTCRGYLYYKNGKLCVGIKRPDEEAEIYMGYKVIEAVAE